MLQKIEASLQQLVERPSVSEEKLAWATRQAKLLFGSFRKADADDPETFTAGCLRLFTAYSPDVVRYVIDPVTGVPGQSEWLPSLRKVKEALDARAGQVVNHRAAAERERDQLEARRRDEVVRKVRPTLDELREKHGPNWSMAPPERETEEAVASRRERMDKANRRSFEAECKAAGVPLDSAVSPSLVALMHGRST